MSFILDPYNHAITLAEINTMGQDFARLVKTSTTTFPNFTYERIKVSSILPLLKSLTPATSSFIKGMKIIPTLRNGNAMRFLYCPTISEFSDEFSGFTIFDYNTEEEPFDMINKNELYWVVNEDLVKLNTTDLQTAIEDFQRYMDEILISHDGSAAPASFENFVKHQDVTSSYVTIDTLDHLVSDNKDSSNNTPAYLYFLCAASEIDGVYRHTSAESIFKPGATSGNNPGNGPFTNKAADFHGVCPPMCKKTVAYKNRLVH